MRKQQRRLENRRQALLHVATLGAAFGESRRLARVFNLSGTELVFIAVLGLIVLGPEKLPGAMRRAGKIYREIRSISGNVQREVQKVMDEPMRQVRSLVEEPANELKKVSSDISDPFAGKMPHLEQRPAAAAAAAFTAAAASATPSETPDAPKVSTEVPVVSTTDGATPDAPPTDTASGD
jgi:Tat protein translocase TatB subunit